MAYSQEQWLKAKEYFEAGLSLSDIVLRTEISKAQISKKSKSENWQKGNEKKHLITQAIEVATKKETLNETALIVHNEIVNEQLRRQNLIFNVTEKIVKNIDKAVSQKRDIFDEEGKVIRQEDLLLDSKSAKEYIDAIDKASLTLGVNQRHSSSQINVNTQNNIQNNNIPLTLEEAKKEALALGVPLEVLIK
ncbi:hypothetical protein [Aliarcobacter butzleri]|uniref:hypothetical protein n=1 Tax=Aliarcobacter butzleri TaxID=28197 RepID=UPI003AF64A2B